MPAYIVFGLDPVRIEGERLSERIFSFIELAAFQIERAQLEPSTRVVTLLCKRVLEISNGVVAAAFLLRHHSKVLFGLGEIRLNLQCLLKHLASLRVGPLVQIHHPEAKHSFGIVETKRLAADKKTLGAGPLSW